MNTCRFKSPEIIAWLFRYIFSFAILKIELSLTIEMCFFKIAGEGQAVLLASAEGSVLAVKTSQPGLFQTITNIVKYEGARYVVHYPKNNF